MHNDRVSTLSLGIAAIMLGHAGLAWMGLVKGNVTLNLIGAAFVTAFAFFKR